MKLFCTYSISEGPRRFPISQDFTYWYCVSFKSFHLWSQLQCWTEALGSLLCGQQLKSLRGSFSYLPYPCVLRGINPKIGAEFILTIWGTHSLWVSPILTVVVAPDSGSTASKTEFLSWFQLPGIAQTGAFDMKSFKSTSSSGNSPHAGPFFQVWPLFLTSPLLCLLLWVLLLVAPGAFR